MVGVIGQTPAPSPGQDHTVTVHTPGAPSVVDFLTSPLGGGIVASAFVALIIIAIVRHLPKWVVASMVVVMLVAGGILTLNPRAFGG